MENKDFIIEDGVLTQYTGNQKDVVIPNGVISIGANAFSCSSEPQVEMVVQA